MATAAAAIDYQVIAIEQIIYKFWVMFQFYGLFLRIGTNGSICKPYFDE